MSTAQRVRTAKDPAKEFAKLSMAEGRRTYQQIVLHSTRLPGGILVLFGIVVGMALYGPPAVRRFLVEHPDVFGISTLLMLLALLVDSIRYHRLSHRLLRVIIRQRRELKQHPYGPPEPRDREAAEILARAVSENPTSLPSGPGPITPSPSRPR